MERLGLEYDAMQQTGYGTKVVVTYMANFKVFKVYVPYWNRPLPALEVEGVHKYATAFHLLRPLGTLLTSPCRLDISRDFQYTLRD